MVEPGRKPPADKRLSLMERQQALLEKQGFSKPAPASPGLLRSSQKKHGQSQPHYGGKQSAFFERQDRHLQRSGQRLNATAASRAAVPMDGGGGGEILNTDDVSLQVFMDHLKGLAVAQQQV